LSVLRLKTPEAFGPLLRPARYKGAHGGRGSGKSHFFANLVVANAVRWRGDTGEGYRFACIREVQKSLKQSAKLLIEDKLKSHGLGEAQGFKVFNEVIETPGGGIITFDGMQDHTADSFKSKEGFHGAWAEEAHSLSDRSLTILRPTIRWENRTLGITSEMLFSWNPQRPTDPIERLLRSHAAPTDAIVVKANWRDNPWFPAVLEQERRDDLANRPERYGHIWEGEYATVFDGAYYAQHLTKAELEDRIGFVPRDPLLPVYAFIDIGGTSGKSDAFAMWVVQFVGREVRWLNYYEAVGQEFAAHVNWLRDNDYGKAICILPHDGSTHDTVYAITPQGYLSKAGFTVEVVQNQGRGAAGKRIDALRALFPRCRFNKDTTEGGRESLGWYHEKRDEHRNMGLGPEHDWSSHGADAAGLVAVYEATRPDETSWGKPMRRNLKGYA
jgi:phage terminase large subunit